MISEAQKVKNKIIVTIPLNQIELTYGETARYVIALYEFEFIPQNVSCSITAEVENHGLTFCVRPHLNGDFFERKFRTPLYLIPSSAFYTALTEEGFQILETSQMSWEVSKK